MAQAKSSVGASTINSAPTVPPATRKLRGASGYLRRSCQKESTVWIDVAIRVHAYTPISCGTVKTASTAQKTVVRTMDLTGVPNRALTLARAGWRYPSSAIVSGTRVTESRVLSSNTKLQITDATKIDVPSA